MAIGRVYAEGRERLTALVEGLSEDEAATPVPGCPGWSVHDVLAHVTGVCTDVLDGNIAGVATVPWTAAQVGARRDRKLTEILDEWRDAGPQVEAFADNFPGRVGPQWVLDLTTHEYDVRAALGRPGGRDSEGVRIGIDFLVTVGLHSTVTAHGLAPLEVRAGAQSWVVGAGGPALGSSPEEIAAAAGERVAAVLMGADPEPPGDPTGILEVDRFELFRALAGRRSAAQIRRYAWSVGPDPYVAAFPFGPFTLSPTDVDE